MRTVAVGVGKMTTVAAGATAAVATTGATIAIAAVGGRDDDRPGGNALCSEPCRSGAR
jgi:hypothetical protein